MTYVVDPNHVVHMKACRSAEDAIPYRITDKGHAALRADLDRLDVSNNHSAPGMLHACDECIDRE